MDFERKVKNYRYFLSGAYRDVEQEREKMIEIQNPYDEEVKPKAPRKNNCWKNYDLRAVNSSIPAEEIVQMIKNAAINGGGIRILFYGASGSGKTKLARYVADSIGKEILLKNASDILGMYVGESERKIAEAFGEAGSSDKILFFDEADSFFRDRNTSSHSWEVTQVNEFLTQMESFDGIVICATNLRSVMDKAMQRRFHLMVEFKPLKADGVSLLLKTYFPKFDFSDCEVKKLCAFNSATPGDFGMIFDRLRFLRPKSVTSDYIVQELCKVQEEKSFGQKPIGFVC